MKKFDYSRLGYLDSTNFTPLVRTPWAGSLLAETIKKNFVAQTSSVRIGESWEFSTEQSFPSRIQQGGNDFLLNEILSTDKDHFSFHLLVKLLNADSPLSLQVHPVDHDVNLKPNECGKPESWLVLDRKPGAGIYLGFSRPFDKQTLRELLLSGEFKKEYLQFVPVEIGDYFEIEPGVTHIVAENVVLLEPQRIIPEKAGKTYRMWDWNRRYDAQGNENPNGQPRELHIDESLAIINPQKDFGVDFANKFRRRPLQDSVSCLKTFPFNGYYQVHWMPSHHLPMRLDQKSGYGCLTVLKGEVSVTSKSKSHDTVKQGQSAFLPQECFPAMIDASHQASWTYVSSPKESAFSIR